MMHQLNWLRRCARSERGSNVVEYLGVIFIALILAGLIMLAVHTGRFRIGAVMAQILDRQAISFEAGLAGQVNYNTSLYPQVRGTLIPDFSVTMLPVPVLGVPSLGIPSASIPPLVTPEPGIPTYALPMPAIPVLGIPSAVLPSFNPSTPGIPTYALPMPAIPVLGIPSAVLPSFNPSTPGIPTYALPMPAIPSLGIPALLTVNPALTTDLGGLAVPAGVLGVVALASAGALAAARRFTPAAALGGTAAAAGGGSAFAGALLSVLGGVLIGAATLLGLAVGIFLAGLVLVKLGVIAGITFTAALIIAGAVLAVGYVMWEVWSRLDEFRAVRGSPSAGDVLAIIGIGVAGITGIPQLIEAIRGARLLTDVPLTDQQRWEAGLGGLIQLLVFGIGVRVATPRIAGWIRQRVRRQPPPPTVTPVQTAARLGINLADLEPAPNSTSGMVMRPPRGSAPLREVRFADEIARTEGQQIIFTRESNTAGIDGFYAGSGRSLQIKTVTSSNINQVIARANDAYRNARNANWTDVEVRIEARNFTSQQILDRWNATNRVPQRVDMSDGTIGRVVIHTSDGIIELPIR